MKTNFDFPLALIRLGVAIATVGVGVGVFVLVHMLYAKDGMIGLAMGLVAAGAIVAVLGVLVDMARG